MAMTILADGCKTLVLNALQEFIGNDGTVEVQASGGAVLAVLTSLAFGMPAAGSMTFAAAGDMSNNATGTASKLVFKTSDGTPVWEVPASDVTFTPSTSITSGGTTTLASGSISA